jgi:hypothetical protein
MKTLLTNYLIVSLAFTFFFLACRVFARYILPRNKQTDIMTSNNELQELINKTKGRFFSITFIKADGTERVINGKDKYERLLKGGVSTVAGAGYTSFVNRNKESWACAKPDSVLVFKCGKTLKNVKVSA